jgi:hypothetical protein
VLAVKDQLGVEPFDFADLTESQTVLLRLDDIAFLAVFNDSGGAIQGLMPKLKKITGPVHGLQLRELMADLAFVNLHLESRPTFHTRVNGLTGEQSIEAKIPRQFALKPLEKALRGRLAARHGSSAARGP